MTIVWSVSQSHAWQCRRQWWYRYAANAPAAQPDAPNRVSGRAKHLALETAYKAAQRTPWQRRSRTMEPTIPAALEALESYWREQDPDVRPWDVNRAAEDVGAVLTKLPMPAAQAVIGPELKFKVPVRETGDTVALFGVIDLGLETGQDAVHLRDWKSNTIPEDVEGNKQLAVYDYVIRRLLPNVRRVTVGLYSIRRNEEVYGELGDSGLHAVREVVLDAWEAAAAVVAAKQPGADPARIFAPAPSERMCDGCPFRSYCPATSGASLPVRPGVDVDAVRESLTRRLDSVSITTQ